MNMPAAKDDSAVPLCVDLDGTLTMHPTHWMLFRRLLWRRPGLALGVCWLWFSKGRLQAKNALVNTVDVPNVMWRKPLLAWLRRQKSTGRHIVLATGAPISLAKKLVAPLGIFDDLVASTETVNCVAENKRDRLVKAFGEKGFDYIGDSFQDIPVWCSARGIYVVSKDKTLLAAVEKMGPEGVCAHVWCDRSGEFKVRG